MRYYFHVRTTEERIVDKEGIELPDITEVAEEAQGAARDILADRVQHGNWIDGEAFEVVDERGQVILELPLSSVLMLR